LFFQKYVQFWLQKLQFLWCVVNLWEILTPLFLCSLLNSDTSLLVSLRFTKRLTYSRPALLSMLQAPLSLN
jgi:hypothetical protein